MYRFFIAEDQIQDGYAWIYGNDVNHIKNVLRMKIGEKVFLSCENDLEYECCVEEFFPDKIKTKILDVHGMETELGTEIVLYQGLPKGDKMDFIIQKAVELGATKIVPVRMKRCIVKLDEKKAKKKTERWNAIALSAAKQAKRGMIPEVSMIKNYKEAIEDAKELGMLLVPYEEARGISYSRELLVQAKEQKSIGIIIGPEGGFEKEEIDIARAAGGKTMTLGKRILRTETAGMAVLSILMFTLEKEKLSNHLEESI